MNSHPVSASKASWPGEGFSLIELMVAVAIFLVVSASVLLLFSRQQTNANQHQNLSALNIGIRNAIAQLQLDMANLGTSSASSSLPNWPIGVTLVNNVTSSGSSCYSSGVYGANCFDQINILDGDPSVLPIYATDSTGATTSGLCSDLTTGYAYGQKASSSITLATTAGYFKSGDQLLFLNSTGTKFASVVLTQDASVYNSAAVKFTFNTTNSDGSNHTTGTDFNLLTNTATNDPLNITACGGGVTSCSAATNFSTSFCTGDWIIRLRPTIYYVDRSTSSNPKLMRKQGSSTAVTLMEQIIGFKVGAAIFNGSDGSGTWGSSYYFYDPSTYTISSSNDSAYLFSLIRSVRVSLIARTQPSSDPSFTFRNAFDQGAYYVQGASVVVAPRNVSMND